MKQYSPWKKFLALCHLLNLEVILPLFLRFWWLGVKLPIWFLTTLLTITWTLNLQMENVTPFLISTFQNHFQHLKESLLWTPFIIYTSISNIQASQDFNSQNVGIHFPTLKRVCLHLGPTTLSWHAPLSCLGCEPKYKAMTLKLSFRSFIKLLVCT
jgi:hypothetical protein